MTEKNKRKEIVVMAPFFIRKHIDSPEVRAIAERLNFFSICGKISKYLKWPITVFNLLLFLFTVNGILNPSQFSFSKPLLFNVFFLTPYISDD